MSVTAENNKRIAKNTLLLYIRMIFLIAISFFTARVLLDKLGIENYGIYNVVGGLAGMFTFFSSSLSNASQRFLNIELGRGSIINARNIVRQHFTLYLLICIGVVILAETVGLWLVCVKLVIPTDRFYAAIWVYQFMVVSLCVTLLGIIFNSEIIAHEDMNVYSYVGVLEGIAKLLICYVLSVSLYDKLIVYGFLLLVITIMIQGYYVWYCIKHYEETSLKLLWNKSLLKNTSSLIGWNTVGTLVYAINDTGVNILLNMFFGPTVNAARAVAFQVSNALNNFSSSFFTSVRPQITKSYASKDFDYLYKLFYGSSKYSFYLLWIFSLPIYFSIDSILSIWLKEVPQYTNAFIVWILIYSLVNVLSNPVWALALTVGRLKWYITFGSTVFLMVFPISYIALSLGYSPVSVFLIMTIVRCFYLLVVLVIMHKYVKYSYRFYFAKVIIPLGKVIVLTTLAAIVLHHLINGDFSITVCFCILSFVLNLVIIWFVGIDRGERMFVLKIMKNKLKSHL